MAAILCQSISTLCSALRVGVETLFCKIPCDACGNACTFFARDIFCGDFGLYMSVTLAMNVPPVLFTLLGLISNLNDDIQDRQNFMRCHSMLMPWMYLDAFLSLVNVVASIYMVNRITEKTASADSINKNHEDEVETGNDGGDYNNMKYTETATRATTSTSSNTMQYTKTNQVNTFISNAPNNGPQHPSERSVFRIKEVLCDDPWVALYIVALILYCLWQSVGISKLVRSHNIYGDTCSNTIRKYMVHSLTCGFFFLALGGSSFFFSLCCATSRANFRLW